MVVGWWLWFLEAHFFFSSSLEALSLRKRLLFCGSAVYSINIAKAEISIGRKKEGLDCYSSLCL